MTKHCFSSSQLYTLRNDINVQVLIEETLRIPSWMTEGCFRFLCPLCNGYDTAVNPKTNLARCFRCEKNFNTIDLVMVVRQADFVHSVKFLQSIHQKDDERHNHHDPMTKSGSSHQATGRMKMKTAPEKSARAPSRIGKILDSVMTQKHADISEKSFDESKAVQPAVTQLDTYEDRIVILEQKLDFLSRQIEKIARTLNVARSSK
jgi:hypothetical protein